jgi:hypothetical protein
MLLLGLPIVEVVLGSIPSEARLFAPIPKIKGHLDFQATFATER